MPQEMTSPLPVFGRVFWMMIGPMVLLILLAVIIQNSGAGWFTGADVTFLVVLGALILTRWLEFRSGQPLTAVGEPAKPGDLRKYVAATIALGLAAWAFANLYANHWA
jgi:hypothetical protein